MFKSLKDRFGLRPLSRHQKRTSGRCIDVDGLLDELEKQIRMVRNLGRAYNYDQLYHMLYGLELDDDVIDEVVRRFLKADPSLRGGWTRQVRDEEDDGNSAAFQYLRGCVKHGRRPYEEPVAYDVSGRIDAEAWNPGPEISEIGEYISQGYLASQDDENVRRRQGLERKRMLAIFDPRMFGPELQAEAAALASSTSLPSISVVSISLPVHGEPSWPNCDSNCWLRREPKLSVDSNEVVPTDPSVPNVDYIYAALEPGRTRVICVRKGLRNTPIVTTLRAMSIKSRKTDSSLDEDSSTPKYETLSYTWMDTNLTHAIVCDGRRLRVTRNLHAALLQLRRDNEDRYLWIDAVCINQKDDAEKSMQVAHMLQIYQGAERVVVWLGESSINSDLAFESMRHLDDNTTRRGMVESRHTEQCLQHAKEIYRALSAIYDRPWFRRTWIRQELVVGKSVLVMCGGAQCSWGMLKRSSQNLRKLHSILKPQDREGLPEPTTMRQTLKYLRRGWTYGDSVDGLIGQIRSMWYYHAGGLLDLLRTSGNFDATDERDRVYALLGLARVPTTSDFQVSQEDAPRLRVDYSRSVSEVFQDVAKYMINRDRNLDVLCLLDNYRDERSEQLLPSWTPDWRVPLPEQQTGYYHMKIAAAGFTQAVIQDPDDVGRLLVEGYKYDVVGEVTDRTCEFALLMNERNAESLPDEDTLAFDPAVHKQRIAKTSRGQLCFVPGKARRGDLIFILRGCKMPMVLRTKVEEDTEAAAKGETLEKGEPREKERLKEKEWPADRNKAAAREEATEREAPKVGKESAERAEETEEREGMKKLVFEVVGTTLIPDAMYGRVMRVIQDNHFAADKLLLV